MRSLAVVTDVRKDGTGATVKSIVSSACTDCPSLCNKYEKSFQASNKKGFQLKPGAFVKIEYSKPVKAVLGIFVLFFPIVLAAAMYFASAVFFNQFSELSRFCYALAGLFSGEVIVFLLSRTNLKLASPEITQVL